MKKFYKDLINKTKEKQWLLRDITSTKTWEGGCGRSPGALRESLVHESVFNLHVFKLFFKQHCSLNLA